METDLREQPVALDDFAKVFKQLDQLQICIFDSYEAKVDLHSRHFDML